MTYPTSQLIADALAAEPCAPEHEARRQEMVAAALQDYYHDLCRPGACPITELYQHCQQIGLLAVAASVANGDFEATKEESDAWAASPEGQAAFGLLSPGMRAAMGAPHQAPEALEPVPQEQLSGAIDRLCEFADTVLNGSQLESPTYGFVLLVGGFNSGTGRTKMTVASNIERENMKALMQNLLERMNTPGAAIEDLAFVEPQGRA